jgi:23S rRNA (adenine-N6)-dimethyltransferase
VGNIPFGDTSRIIAKLLSARPTEAWLVVQREAAQRFAGLPWAPETVQSLLLKPAWHVEIRGWLRRIDFEPPPAVDAGVLQLRRRERPLARAHDYEQFVRACFGSDTTIARCLRRVLTRTQISRLAHDLHFAVDARPSELTFEQWLGIYRYAAGEML